MKIRHVQCKSILSKSGLADYCLNCYIGCVHGCCYCYANFMRRYTGHKERWGEFVDVKINAAEVLAKEVKKKKKGEVFVSSVCDGWQPPEAKYKLTRKCLQILLENEFSITILTKSALIKRDFDLLRSNPEKVKLGFTLTCLDEELQKIIEPCAASPLTRISLLRKAADSGIRVYVFLGPLLPYLSDREPDMDKLFRSLRDVKLEYIYLDRLNRRYGIWESLSPVLRKYYPGLYAKYKMLLFDKDTSQAYSTSLAGRVKKAAERYGLKEKLNLCF